MTNTEIQLNATQIATLEGMRDSADAQGVIHADVASYFKQNVVLALLNKGALQLHRDKHYKVVRNVTITERPAHIHRPSTLLKMAERAAMPRNPVGRPRKTSAVTAG